MITALHLRPLSLQDTDWRTFISLLTLADLPTPYLEDGGRFFLMEDETGLIGFGGLEGDGADQLIRSVVMAPGLRRRGLGPRLVDQLVQQAKACGAERLWLLTTEADQFFAELGWTAVERDSAPEKVQGSRLFRDGGPATAVLIVRSLS